MAKHKQTKEHKQVAISWKDMIAEVDEELAPLILALWQRNIWTLNSCQENRPGISWIQFATAYDAERFLNAVAVYPDTNQDEILPWETLYGRIRGWGGEGQWEYATYIEDMAVEDTGDGDEISTGPPQFVFSVSIRFPKSDIPAILERLGTPTPKPCNHGFEAWEEALGTLSEVLASPKGRQRSLEQRPEGTRYERWDIFDADDEDKSQRSGDTTAAQQT